MVAAGIHTLYSGYATIEICASPGALANYMPVAAPRTPRFLIVSALARAREKERVSGHIVGPSDLLRAFFALGRAGGNRKAASD